MSNNFENIIESKLTDFDSGEFDFEQLAKYKLLIKDNSYFDFVIKSNNGGYFFNQSLHIYGYSHEYNFNDIEFVNTLLKREYLEMFTGLMSFGQDLFGNQFCFDINSESVVDFNPESGERKTIATHFEDWIEVLFNEFDYFIGPEFLKEWRAENDFTIGKRLYPKIPFIIGGQYEINNLFGDYKSYKIDDFYIKNIMSINTEILYYYKLRVTYEKGTVEEIIALKSKNGSGIKLNSYHANSDLLIR